MNGAGSGCVCFFSQLTHIICSHRPEATGGGRILAQQNGRAVGLAYRKVEPGGDRDLGLRGGRVELRFEPGGEGPASRGGVVLGEGELIARFAQFDRLVGLQIAREGRSQATGGGSGGGGAVQGINLVASEFLEVKKFDLPARESPVVDADLVDGAFEELIKCAVMPNAHFLDRTFQKVGDLFGIFQFSIHVYLKGEVVLHTDDLMPTSVIDVGACLHKFHNPGLVVDESGPATGNGQGRPIRPPVGMSFGKNGAFVGAGEVGGSYPSHLSQINRIGADARRTHSNPVIRPIEAVGFSGYPVPVGIQDRASVNRTVVSVPRHIGGVAIKGVPGHQAEA